ncbi:MAG: DUF2878 domain-containing protein [Pseudohongiellaceae bacterium]
MTALRTTSEKRRLGYKWLLTLDLILFKLCWVLLVVFQASVLTLTMAILIVRIALSENWRHRLRDAALVMVTGLVMDGAFSAVGLFRFQGGLLPLWMVMIWASFALTLPLLAGFLHRCHTLVLVLTGAVNGVVAYLAGYLLDGIGFGLPLLQSLLVVGAAWSLYLPLTVIALGRIQQGNSAA